TQALKGWTKGRSGVAVQHMEVESGGEQWDVVARSLSRDPGFEWTAVVAVPGQDFMGDVNANHRTALLIALAGILLPAPPPASPAGARPPTPRAPPPATPHPTPARAPPLNPPPGAGAPPPPPATRAAPNGGGARRAKPAFLHALRSRGDRPRRRNERPGGRA